MKINVIEYFMETVDKCPDKNEPNEFFDNPQSDRLKMFLEQILDH